MATRKSGKTASKTGSVKSTSDSSAGKGSGSEKDARDETAAIGTAGEFVAGAGARPHSGGRVVTQGVGNRRFGGEEANPESQDESDE